MDGLRDFLNEAIARRVSGKYESEKKLENLDTKSTYRDFISLCEAMAVNYGPMDDLQSTKMYSEICSLAKKKGKTVYSTANLGNIGTYIVVGNMYGQCIVLIFVGAGRDPRLGIINSFEEFSDQRFAIRDMYGNSGSKETDSKELEQGIDDLKKILRGEKI